MQSVKVRTTRDLGALIRDARSRTGLTQDELGRQIGVARLWVSQLETGKGGANIGDVLRVLNVLGIDLTAASRTMAVPDQTAPRRASIVEKILKESRRRDG